jgi:hypothetical protein
MESSRAEHLAGIILQMAVTLGPTFVPWPSHVRTRTLGGALSDVLCTDRPTKKIAVHEAAMQKSKLLQSSLAIRSETKVLLSLLDVMGRDLDRIRLYPRSNFYLDRVLLALLSKGLKVAKVNMHPCSA